jgi:hypothetical protein
MECHSSEPRTAEPSKPIAPPKRQRVRLAISVRVMMLLVLIVAVWAAWRVNRARTIQHAIATIQVASRVLLDSPLDDSGQWKSRFHPPRWLYDALGKEHFSQVKTVQINAAYVHALDPEVLQAIASLPGLIRLELIESQKNADLEKVSALTNIKEIQIFPRMFCRYCAALGGTGKYESWPLELNRYAPTTESLCHLSRMKNLQSVELGGGLSVDASVLEALVTLPDLRALRVEQWARIHSAELVALAKFTRLHELEVWGYVSHSNYERLRSRSLPIKSGPLPFPSWNELRSLSLVGLSLSPEEIGAIIRLPKLETLKLDHIGIGYSEIGDSELLILREIKGLKKLKIDPTGYSPQAINALQAASPNLVIESL